jgi:hypothetical protein
MSTKTSTLDAELEERNKARLAEVEKEDIEHGREVCHDFIAYQVLSALEAMFPEGRYTNLNTLDIPQEGLHCLFHLLATTLRNDVENHFGRH